MIRWVAGNFGETLFVTSFCFFFSSSLGCSLPSALVRGAELRFGLRFALSVGRSEDCPVIPCQCNPLLVQVFSPAMLNSLWLASFVH